jgi:hypothetical protein
VPTTQETTKLTGKEITKPHPSRSLRGRPRNPNVTDCLEEPAFVHASAQAKSPVQRKGRRKMMHRRHRLAARFLAIVLLAATLYAVDSLASPSPAEARCTGVNQPVKSTFIVGGRTVASETPLTGTCNGNQLYQGVLRDESADGYCVYVQFKETGIDWTPAVPPGALCGGSASFEWRDRNDNSRVYEWFCIQPRSGVNTPAAGAPG